MTPSPRMLLRTAATDDSMRLVNLVLALAGVLCAAAVLAASLAADSRNSCHQCNKGARHHCCVCADTL